MYIFYVCRGDFQVTALAHDTDGLGFCAGTSSGHCLLYDLRSSKPLHIKEHQYGFPIIDIKFHGTSRKVISTDKKIVKIWERDAVGDKGVGAIMTNIETEVDINSVCVVADHRGDSGLLFLPGEQERVMVYYVPGLGPAPKWCSFLDSITEELEENAISTVYDDYKFLTKQEVEELNAANLIGTPLLRAYMHGYFMDTALYHKLRAVSEPFAFEEYRKKKLKERIEAKRASRIGLQKKLPKVNQVLAQRMAKGKKQTENVDLKNPTGDDRFSKLFTSSDFVVDEESEEFKLINPSGPKKLRGKDGSDDELMVKEAFQDVSEGEEEDDDQWTSEDENSEASSSDDGIPIRGDAAPSKFTRKSMPPARRSEMNRPKYTDRKRPKFMELQDTAEDADVYRMYSKDTESLKQKSQAKKVPLSQRLKEMKSGKSGRGFIKGKASRDIKIWPKGKRSG